MSEKNSDENLQDISSWVHYSHSIWKIIISAIDAPQLLFHIYTHGNTATGLNKPSFRHHIRKLVKLKIIRLLDNYKTITVLTESLHQKKFLSEIFL